MVVVSEFDSSFRLEAVPEEGSYQESLQQHDISACLLGTCCTMSWGYTRRTGDSKARAYLYEREDVYGGSCQSSEGHSVLATLCGTDVPTKPLAYNCEGPALFLYC